MLTAVAEAGSFSAAARQLRRTQSVVSYTIANLEAQLGLKLFDRGERRPALTEAGRAVLGDARRVAATVEELRARAAGLRGGLEAEIGLAVDVMFPTCRLVATLDAFARAFPTVELRLHMEALGAVVALVLERRCVLGVAGWMAQDFEALDRRPLGEAWLVPVASPQHPLAGLPPPTAIEAARGHTQLVLADRSSLTAGRDFGVLARHVWRLGDLGAKHALLRAGLGWGNMPELMVRDDLATGRLIRLPIQGHESQAFPMLLVHRTDTPPGTAGRWLAERLERSQAALPAPEQCGRAATG